MMSKNQPVGQALRHEFPIFAATARTDSETGQTQPLHYLDSGATTQKPRCVIRAVTEFLENSYGTVHRGAYRLSDEASGRYEGVRRLVAQLVGKNVNPRQVVFTRGTTESINLLAWSLGECRLTENSRIVLPAAEHHANLIPWQQAALRKNCEIAYISMQEGETQTNLDLDRAARLISPNTRIVALARVGNVLGQVNPLPEIAAMAHSVGAVVIVDAAQSISCFSDDLFALGADAVAFSGHKMYGPSGVGVLVARPELLEEMPPMMFGGGMIESVTLEGSTWAAPPTKFEAGTPPITEVIGLGAAIEWLEGIGRDTIHNHCARLTSQLLNALDSHKDIKVFSARTGRETVVSFRHKTIHAHDLATILDSHNIAVRAGHHCAWPLVRGLGIDALVRASFGAYSDMDDVEALIDVLEKAHTLI